MTHITQHMTQVTIEKTNDYKLGIVLQNRDNTHHILVE